MKKPDPFIFVVMTTLIVLLAMINFVTESAIKQESVRLSNNLEALQFDILENMIGDYISGMALVDDMAIESDSHNVEASMKLMDYMMNGVSPNNKSMILKIFGDDPHIPIAVYDRNSRQIEYCSPQNVFFISPKSLKEAEFFLEKDDFYYIEDVYLTPDRELAKQRLFFYKSPFDAKLYISKVSFEGATRTIKKSSQIAINKTLEKIEQVIQAKVIAVNGEGEIVLTSDHKFMPLGSNIIRFQGNESLLQSLKASDSVQKQLTWTGQDNKIQPFGFSWFKADQLYVLTIDMPKERSSLTAHLFFLQRILMVCSISGIILIIFLMRRNFLYFIEKSDTQEGL